MIASKVNYLNLFACFVLLSNSCLYIDAESVNLDDYNIHVIASVFKQWLRDLPNPLMTFELYEEFLRAMGKHSLPGFEGRSTLGKGMPSSL